MTQDKIEDEGGFDCLPAGGYDPTRVRVLSLYLHWRDGVGEWPSFERLVNLESINHLPAAYVSPATFEQLRQLPKLRSVHMWFTGQPIPAGLFKITQLEELCLNDADATELPDLFDGLPALRVLDLHSNQLQSLPPSIARLTRLRELDLSSNALSATPELSGCASLETLDLAENLLTAIDVSKLPGGLRELSVLGCPIAALPESITSLAALRVLNARYCPLEHVPDALYGLQTLEALLIDTLVKAQ